MGVMWEIQNVRAAPTTISLPWHEKDHDDDGVGDGNDDNDDDDDGGDDGNGDGDDGDGGEDVGGTDYCGDSDDGHKEKEDHMLFIEYLKVLVLMIMMMITMTMVMMKIMFTMVMVMVGRTMNGGEIEKTADDFTEAQMKPSNMQNMPASPLRMLNTMIMNRVIGMTIMVINGDHLLMRNRSQDRYNSEESLEEENQSTTSSTESRQSDFAKKEEGFIPTRRYC